MPHAIGEEGVFAELARVKRERDEAEAENVRLTDAVNRAASGGICGLCLDSIAGQDTATVTRRAAVLEEALRTIHDNAVVRSSVVSKDWLVATCRRALLPEKQTEGK